MRNVTFTCPECAKYNQLKEIMVNAICISDIFDISIRDGVAGCSFGEPSIDDGTVDHYECGYCGYTLKIESVVVNNPEKLALWFEEIRKKGKKEEETA